MRRPPPKLQDLARFPQAWQGGQFRYNPYSGHELYFFARDRDEVAPWFREPPAPLELCWAAPSMLVLGLAWGFKSIEGTEPTIWSGTLYSHHSDPYRWPPVVAPDPRLLPPSLSELRLVLASIEGEIQDERRVRLSARFAQALNHRIGVQNLAYNNPGWLDDVSDQLVRRHPTPASLARTVPANSAHRCTTEG